MSSGLARSEETAARTVSQRRIEGHAKSSWKSITGTGNPMTSLEDRSRQEFHNRAQRLGVAGRSKTSKEELVRALRNQQGGLA